MFRQSFKKGDRFMVKDQMFSVFPVGRKGSILDPRTDYYSGEWPIVKFDEDKYNLSNGTVVVRSNDIVKLRKSFFIRVTSIIYKTIKNAFNDRK